MEANDWLISNAVYISSLVQELTSLFDLPVAQFSVWQNRNYIRNHSLMYPGTALTDFYLPCH